MEKYLRSEEKGAAEILISEQFSNVFIQFLYQLNVIFSE